MKRSYLNNINNNTGLSNTADNAFITEMAYENDRAQITLKKMLNVAALSYAEEILGQQVPTAKLRLSAIVDEYSRNTLETLARWWS